MEGEDLVMKMTCEGVVVVVLVLVVVVGIG